MILALNETLYPFHKWFLSVLESVPDKPVNLMQNIDILLKEPTEENMDIFCNSIFEHTDWGFERMKDSDYFLTSNELNWIDGKPPICDM